MLTQIREQLHRWADRYFRTPSAGTAAQQAANLGAQGERYAARYLRKRGYKILEQGHRQRRGEIDIVAVDQDTIVFVEVKTRNSGRHGTPAQAVDATKQRFLTRAALIYLKKHGLLELPCRFDVIAIVWPPGQRKPKLQHFQNAFEAHGPGSLWG